MEGKGKGAQPKRTLKTMNWKFNEDEDYLDMNYFISFYLPETGNRIYGAVERFVKELANILQDDQLEGRGNELRRATMAATLRNSKTNK